jgi:hypothetical protein
MRVFPVFSMPLVQSTSKTKYSSELWVVSGIFAAIEIRECRSHPRQQPRRRERSKAVPRRETAFKIAWNFCSSDKPLRDQR